MNYTKKKPFIYIISTILKYYILFIYDIIYLIVSNSSFNGYNF